MRVYALHRPPRRRRPRPQPGPPRVRQGRLAARRRPRRTADTRLAGVPPRPVEATANPTRRHPRPVRRHRNHRPGCESPRPPRHHRRPVRRLLPHRHLADQRPRPAGQGHAGTPPTGPGRRATRPVRRPGRCVVLLTDDADALWVTSWPFPEFVRHAWAGSMLCTLFRREPGCPHRASDLIVAAVAATRARWPHIPPQGMVTFIDPAKVRRKRDPGRCFRRAGFTPVGHTASGLVALQLRPADFPAPIPARPRYAHGQGDLFGEADPWPDRLQAAPASPFNSHRTGGAVTASISRHPAHHQPPLFNLDATA